MALAPSHPREVRRLAAARHLRLLGTPPEERFDRLTRMACKTFNVPMALIDIVGEKVVWIKGATGTDSVHGIRKDGYCQYTILKNETCVIEDARLDPRTRDSPYAASHVFYAGVPLKFDGENVGVFCIADNAPKKFSLEQQGDLIELAAMAEQEMVVVSLSNAQLALAASHEELEMESMLDGLTRLWNRTAIMELAARELEAGRTNNTATGLLILDIDHFKMVNDTHGHPAGDEVLRRVAERLRMVVRPGDAVGRYGGEEFIVILPACGEDVVPIADRIREKVQSEPIPFGKTHIPVTVSIGTTVSREGTHFVDTLIKVADSALYKAKRGGRNRVENRSVPPPSFAHRLGNK
jgi:diguanylate cyclase (GGDEF)-like protein